MAREGELHSSLYLPCPDHDGDTVLPPDPLRMLISPPLNVLLGSHLLELVGGWSVLRSGKHRAEYIPAGHAEHGPHFSPDSSSHLWLAMCFLGFTHVLAHSVRQKGFARLSR